MATHNVNRAVHAQTTDGVVDTVNLAYSGSVLRVKNADAAGGQQLIFTIDGSTIGATYDDCYVLDPQEQVFIEGGNVTVVKLRTDGGVADYYVEKY